MMRRILAAATLLILLVAPPLVLLQVGFTDVAAIPVWTASDVRPVLFVLTCLAWLAWAWWALAVLVEVATMARRGPRLRVPGLTLPRTLAAGLLAVAFASANPAAHAAPAAVPVAVQAPRVVEPAGVADAGSGVVVHRVTAGDDLWSLAEHFYGEGVQWRRIAAANAALADDPLAPLVAGQELTIPDPVRLVTVARGDTLSGLALRHLGDAHRWPEIQALNLARVPDPDVIDIGWVLKVPWVASVAAPQPPAERQQEPRPDADVPGGVPQHGDGADAGAGDARPAETPEASAVPAPVQAGQAADAVPSEVGEPPRDERPEGPDGLSVTVETEDAAAIAPADLMMAGVTAVSAAAVVGGIGLQRLLQRHHRPVGRRFVQPGDELARYESALRQVAAPAAAALPLGAVGAPAREHLPSRDQLLARAQRLLAESWRGSGQPAPALTCATLDDHGVSFDFAQPPVAAPDGFVRVGSALATTWEQLEVAPDLDGPCAFPALVTLGRDASGSHVMLDAMESGVLAVACDAVQGRREVLSAILIELGCARWADELELTVVTDDPDFARAAASTRLRTEADAGAALTHLERQAGTRHAARDERAWRDRRLDADLAPAWAPRVTLFERPVTDAELDRLRAALDDRGDGLAAIVGVGATAEPAAWQLDWAAEGGHIRASTIDASPQTVSDDTRAAVTGLFALATTTTTEPAPWWPEEGTDMDIVSIRAPREDARSRAEARWETAGAPAPATTRADAADVADVPDAPRLHLLGPIELTGCAGETPSRAVRQCVEYCAWLHLHPGASPQQMGRSLLVAEGTRRSNMSRLRSWLGSAPDGRLYLPDAYSGRIWLADDVTSDWGDLLVLTASGLNSLPLERLLAGLRLVRGAPLADAAPGQWGWAEEIRADAGALIRDLGVVAARRALEGGDIEAARWAASRALVAAPDDELLMVERIRTEHRAGRPDDVRRLVQRVTRTAQSLGLDLLPETVDVCQQVVEGRIRARG